MSFFGKIIGRKKKVKDIKVTVLGPSKAGKTTFIRYLATGEQQLEAPRSTLGIEYRQKGVEIEDWSFHLIDVGGQQVYQDVFWELAIEQANAFIYVIDSTVRPNKDVDLFSHQLDQFQYALGIIPEDSILLILLNKQDLVDENPILSKEFTNFYPLKDTPAKMIAFMPSSAKYGDGITEAMQWFVDALNAG
ncbi:MAG: ADP-ribosylation factor-like protein [Candidatus Odinarchaeota archaeon]